MADDLSKAALALLLLLTITRGIVYVLVIPPWQTPDEPAHFGYVRFIAQNRRLPLFEIIPVDEEAVTSMAHFDFWTLRYHALRPVFLDDSQELRIAARHPPLYYVLGTLLLMPLMGEDVIRQLYVLRLASVVMAALTVLVAFCTAKMLFPGDNTLPLTVSAFIAFLPMHSFMSASVNNDSLAQLVASLLIYLLIKLFRDGMSSLRGLGLTILLVAGYFTKRTTFFTIPLVVMTVPVYLWTRTFDIRESWLTAQRWLRGPLSKARGMGTVMKDRPELRKRIAIMAFIGIICGALCIFLIGQRQVGRHYGSSCVQATLTHQLYLPLLAKQHGRLAPAWLEMTLSPILKFARISPAEIERALSRGDRDASAMSSYLLFSLLTFASFWANFGWMNIPLDPAWYGVLAVVSLISFLGLALRMLREITSSREQILFRERWQKAAFLVLLVASLLMLAQTSSLMAIQNIPQQGRYLFPVIVPLSILFVLGLRELIPSSYRHVFLLICIIGLFLFDGLCLTYYILPYFYG